MYCWNVLLHLKGEKVFLKKWQNEKCSPNVTKLLQNYEFGLCLFPVIFLLLFFHCFFCDYCFLILFIFSRCQTLNKRKVLRQFVLLDYFTTTNTTRGRLWRIITSHENTRVSTKRNIQKCARFQDLIATCQLASTSCSCWLVFTMTGRQRAASHHFNFSLRHFLERFCLSSQQDLLEIAVIPADGSVGVLKLSWPSDES